MKSFSLIVIVSWLGMALVWPCQASEPSLKYFGFYKNVSVDPNEIQAAATADFSNIAWIAGGPSDPPQKYVDTITRVNCLGMRAVVDVSDVFFDYVTQPDGTIAWKLQDGWDSHWSQFASTIAPVLENVVALYIFDEPSKENIELSDLVTAVGAIKTRFPNIPIAIIYSDGSAPTKTAAEELPAIGNVDWVGIACYSLSPVKCGDTDFSVAIGNLEEALSSNQRLILLPQAALPSDAACSPDSECETELLQVAQDMYDLATHDPMIVGLIPFIYGDIPNWRGFETLSSTMPTLKNKVEDIGRTISTGIPTTSCKKNGPLVSPILSTLLNNE